MVGKLTEKEMYQLEKWIEGGPKTFTLLYAITRDGCNNNIFHQRCNNQGPTITVLYNQEGSVYGGYTAVSWQSSENYGNDSTAFLFQLRFNNQPKCRKFPVANSTYAICDNSVYGPYFGGANGDDLCTFKRTIHQKRGCYRLNGSMNIGYDYNNQGVPTKQINNGTMSVTELEVYKVAGKPLLLPQEVTMGCKLTEKEMYQLEQWIGGGPKTFTLLYAITRDGCNNNVFHQRCNNQGPTVTVLYNQEDSVYGGYTAVSWESSGNYGNDPTAFLFQLRFNNQPKCTKFPVTNSTYAICDNSVYGPYFGGANGDDLCTFSGTIDQTRGFYRLNGSMNIGYDYNNQGVPTKQINNGTMSVTELEVYKVADGKRKRTRTKPWREIKGWNEKPIKSERLDKKRNIFQFLDELTEYMVAFKPDPDSKIHAARILMIGPVGAGKSSFLNTINSIFRGRITQKASCGSAEQSLTTEYVPYTVRVRSGASLNFRLCDTRGLEENQGLDVLECNYLLDGHIKEYYQFNPATPVTPNAKDFIAEPAEDDRIHCVVFVVDSTTLEVLPAKILQKMKSFQNLMNQKGIIQALLLTKIDRLCDKVEENVSNVFRSDTVKEHVEKASQLLGLPRGNILPVKNYENETLLEENISILALIALRHMLYFAEDYIESSMERMAAAGRRKEKFNQKKMSTSVLEK